MYALDYMLNVRFVLLLLLHFLLPHLHFLFLFFSANTLRVPLALSLSLSLSGERRRIRFNQFPSLICYKITFSCLIKFYALKHTLSFSFSLTHTLSHSHTHTHRRLWQASACIDIAFCIGGKFPFFFFFCAFFRYAKYFHFPIDFHALLHTFPAIFLRFSCNFFLR